MVILFDEVNGNEIEPTEQDSEILSELNRNIEQLNENVTNLNEKLEEQTEDQTEEQTEEQTKEQTEETTQDSLVIDSSVDNHLYLSGSVEGATLDHVYSVMLSTRNLILLFGLFILGWKLFGSLKNMIYRIMDK